MKVQPPRIEGGTFECAMSDGSFAFGGTHLAPSGKWFSPTKVGDVFYVRETFGWTCNIINQKDWLDGIPHVPSSDFPSEVAGKHGADALIYEATSGVFEWCDDDGFQTDKSSWKPSIHMPKWASRIHLEVMRVRVERACDISEEDARAEGCGARVRCGPIPTNAITLAVPQFKSLWQSIYGPDSLDKWCWVYDLKRIK